MDAAKNSLYKSNLDNMNSCYKIGICLLVFVNTLIPLTGASQSGNNTDSIQNQPVALELGEIPDYGKQTRKLINDITLNISDDKNLDEIASGIVEVTKVVNQKFTDLSDTLRTVELDRLDKEERELSLLNQRILEWKTNIQGISQDGLIKDSAAMQMLQIWQLTLNSNSDSENPDTETTNAAENSVDLQTEIQNFITDLTASRKRLSLYLDSIQNIQTKITIVENKVGNISDLIQTNKRHLKQNIWLPDSPPIWKMRKDTVEISVLQRTKDFTAADLNILGAFLKNNPRLPYYFGIIIIIILAIILYLRSRSEQLYSDFKAEFHDADIVLKNPLLSTLIIVWFGTLFFPFFPKELKDLISLFMLIPLVIVLKKLNSNWKWYSHVLFVFSYIFFLTVRDFNYTHLFQRVFLILLNILTLLLFFYYKKYRSKTETMNKFWFGTLPFIINVFIGIGLIALIANIFGSIQLAQLLVYVSLGIIVVIYALKTAVTLVRNFIFLILMGPLMQHSYILKEDGMLILKKMDKLFRIISFVALLYILLEMLNIGKETLDAFRGIINYKLSIGEMNISLGRVFAFFITIQVAIWISNITRYVLEKEVFPRSTMKQGIPNTILIMTKFTLTIFGILFAFAAAGIQMDKLAIAMGALGVGIGFGLQNIISNFISGIILALERPITIGDLIEIPNVSGVVKDIGIRASTVRTWDGSDVIVPNAELVSNKLTNWTFYDRLRRVKVDVRVPFDTDIEMVSKLLLNTANSIPEVMKKPKAYLNFKGIGTSAMEITLYCWTDDSDKIFTYGTAIRKAVYNALSEAGYETPVPVQDLKIIK